MNDWTRAAIVHLWRHYRDGDAPPAWDAPLSWQRYRWLMQCIVKEGYGR